MDSAWHRVRAQNMLTVGEMRQGREERDWEISPQRGDLGWSQFTPKQTSSCRLSRHSPSSTEPRASSTSVLLNSAPVTSSCWRIWGSLTLNRKQHFHGAEMFMAACRHVGSSGGSVKWARLMLHGMNLLCEASWGFSWKASLSTDISFFVSSVEMRGIKPKD